MLHLIPLKLQEWFSAISLGLTTKTIDQYIFYLIPSIFQRILYFFHLFAKGMLFLASYLNADDPLDHKGLPLRVAEVLDLQGSFPPSEH